MSLVSITNLTFSYDGSYDNIFEKVSFALDTNWRLGFVGRNGRGKTTFLKLLLGQYEYTGEIRHSVSFEYFPYSVLDKTRKTCEIIFDIAPYVELWQVQRELNLLQVAPDCLERPFDTLSQGEQTKILLATLFLKENSFLLIDEPTNHLDLSARQLVSEYLKSKSGFILVCHDRHFLDSCTDYTLSINKNNIEIQKGSFSSWYKNKEDKDAFEREQDKKLRGEIGRLEIAAKRSSDWSDTLEATKYNTKNAGLRPDRGAIGAQSARMMKKAKSFENRQKNAITEKSQLLKNVEEADKLKLSPLVYHSDTLVHIKELSVFYGQKQIFDKLSFDILHGDKVCLVGANGSGKSSLIKLILGEDICYSGIFQKGSGIKISYLSQADPNFSGSLKSFAVENKIDESLFKTILRKLGFERQQLEKDMADFSLGQRKKVQLAKSLCERAHLYIWDEPLNYVDVLSRIQIEQLLSEYPLSLLFVEHDEAFTNKIANKIVLL